MMYNSHHIQHVLIQNCYFEECVGDYIRFRDNTDNCVVQGCVFKSTGKVYEKPYPFLSISVFNDCKPGSLTTSPDCSREEPSCPDPEVDPQYEYFGTNFVFADNQFLYESGGGRRFAIAFIHAGWDPPGRFHLFTADEGNILEKGSVRSKRRLLKRYCGIDTDRVIVYDNVFQGEAKKAVFESYPAYCATSEWQAKGENAVDIFDLFNPDSVSQPSQWLGPILYTILNE
jgi:hypothetical protein